MKATRMTDEEILEIAETAISIFIHLCEEGICQEGAAEAAATETVTLFRRARGAMGEE